MRLPLFSSLLACAAAAKAQVTIYGVFGSTTTAASSQSTPGPSSTIYQTVHGPATYTGLEAYNQVYLQPPPIPSPAPANQFTISLPNAAAGMNALSVPQAPTFFGFSIEMSVANQLIGTNSSRLHVPFLNLMALIVEKAGAVHVRVGGNTQDTAFMVDSFPDGKMMEKDKEDASNPTSTPVLAFTPDLLYMLANVSSLVNCHWYLGVPFNDTANWRLEIAELGEAILGDHLLGFQAGNEPDLYGKHGHRNLSYSEWDYFGEFSLLTQAYQNDAKITNKKSLIAPSTAGGNWPVGQSVLGPEPVWNTGFVQAYDQWLSALAVERYPNENCAAIYPTPDNPPVDLIDAFPQFLTHQTGLDTVKDYLNSTMLAQTWGKPFLMFETNTASCGGFMGISDAFAAALWGVDWALQLANSNFTGALFHAGGQNVAYNPFTAPPTNQSAFHQWTIGPIFYSAIVVTEALGTSNTSRVKDLFPNDGNSLTPAYAIYENDQLARMVLINFMDDPTGANDYTANIQVGGQQFGEGNSVPAQVKVKYLLAPSVSEKDNITWAGQTLGGRFQVDGRWKGTESVQTVQCDQTANTCPIKVPAPGAALVFISDAAQQGAAAPESYSTFPTTVVTKTANTVSVDASVLATSNGNSGKDRANRLGGTSQGGANAAAGTYGVRAERAAIVSAFAGVVVGGMVMFTRALW
ncbi:Glycoside Hydrolase Family 79 protein [Trametes cinnabarina]|uniref:Glycoside Hydrolase Family 79 protein n=1 Tax=Pycnoporus cinnabarinus TaxID=5643 RepID=A0A060SI68_PYCCI|nr:Glycoside Hydrolase Family 79 protein [Trametes cinnabarina]